MFHIIICDDEKVFADHISQQIRDIMKTEEMDYTVTYCKDTVQLNDCIRQEQCDLLFLDIRMPGANGMEYARRLRSTGNNIPIVFVTSNTEYALEAYDVYPLTFLEKPIKKEALQRTLLRCLEIRREEDGPFLVFRDKKKGMVSLRYDDIFFAESRQHGIILRYGAKGEYELRDSFQRFCAQFPQDLFIQCHRCYVVNLKHVRRVQNRVLLLENGEELPVSRAQYKEVKERFAQI